ncbi:MAG: tRNA lysidine(34) synthetase TilS [Pseudomonadota bacterium]
MAPAIQSCLEQLPEDCKKIYLAFSGGLDSCVLLHLLITADLRAEVIPWHINHNLVENASEMEAFCRQLTEQLGLDLKVDHLDNTTMLSNTEAQARKLRYQCFETKIASGDCLLTAHHADDQAETFLLNALRGSGVAGLRGIAKSIEFGKGLLMRPLLEINREALEEYARNQGLDWFEDPSNLDMGFDRNYLRKQVIPAFKTRWPNFENAFLRVADIQSEAQELLDDLAEIDFQEIKSIPSQTFDTLALKPFLLLSQVRQKNLIRYWILHAGFKSLPNARLHELLKQLRSKQDSIPEIRMDNYSIRRYDRRLFLVPLAIEEVIESGNAETDDANVEIENFWGRQVIFEKIGIPDKNQAISLKFRNRNSPHEEQHRMKRLFQKYKIPPWQRDRIPLVYLDGKLEGILL